MIDIIGKSYQSDRNHVSVIIYNDKAKYGQFTELDYKTVGRREIST